MQHLQPNTTLQGGKYKIERVLGQGNFGITYLAQQTRPQRIVAIKELFLNVQGINDRQDNSVIVSNNRNKPMFEQQINKFKKEAKRIMSLNNEHIVPVYDLFDENNTAYYVMEYVEGESLADKMARQGHPFSVEEVQNFFPQILDALTEIHSQQILHLDIKPGNIMVDKRNVIKLIDFGASKQLTSEETALTGFYFTRGYAPSEQTGMLFDKFGPWTDLYAVGATMYNLLTAKSPVQFDIEDFTNDEIPEDYLGLMYLLINWMLQPKRQDRPQSAIDVKQRYYVELVKIGVLSIFSEKLDRQVTKTNGEDIDLVKDMHATEAQCKEIKDEINNTFGVDVSDVPSTFDYFVVAVLTGLGLYFLDGDDEEQDDEVTVLESPKDVSSSDNYKLQELKRKANAGQVEAQLELGYYYQTELNDLANAFYWYERAAIQGDPTAIHNIGNCYLYGQGVQQDYSRAFQCFQMAASKGSIDAINSLGYCYDKGYGISQNSIKAIEEFTKAAELGEPYAQNNLGICYQNGRGVERNYEKAIEWYTKAAEQGHEDAKRNLESLREVTSTPKTKQVDFFDDCLWPASMISTFVLIIYTFIAMIFDWPTLSTTNGWFVQENTIPMLVFAIPTIVLTLVFYSEDGF